jgi:hypothetical protein
MQGLALHQAMARYDKAVGYPMAWFFHMLTTRSAPHALANAVIDDVAGRLPLPARSRRAGGQGVAVPALRLLKPVSVLALSNADLFQIYESDLPTFTLIVLNLARELSRRLRSIDDLAVRYMPTNSRPDSS